MRNTVICFIIIQITWQIPSINAQRSIQQYIHLTGLPCSTVQLPATTQTTATNNQITTQQRPTTGLPSLSALSLPSLIAALSTPKSEAPLNEPQKPSSSIDSKLLNNLAIALQLLVLSNIINSPMPTAGEKTKVNNAEPIQSQLTPQNNYSPAQNNYSPIQNNYSPAQITYSPSQITYSPSQNPGSNVYITPQTEQVMPNTNYVGSTGFGEPNLAPPFNPVRNSMTLMSPYEALGTLSTFPDTVPQFQSSNPRKDFQSPYAMLLEKDLFSTNDLF